MAIQNQKRLGRPPLSSSGPAEPVYLKLVPEDYQRAERLAKKRRESIQDVIRFGLQRLLKDERGL